MKPVLIGETFIGEEYPPMIVGELSGNHRGDLDIALQSIKEMKRCGLTAVKIQTLKPENMTFNLKKQDFIVDGGTIWDGTTFFDLYTDIYTPWEWTEPMMKLCKELQMEFFSSPFGHDEIEFLYEKGISAFKIASFEITDIPLIEHAASKGLPIIISTGIANMDDISLAIETCRNVGNENIVILKCTSSYPTPISEMNLKNILNIRNDFNVHVGLSDHSLDNRAAVVATALGAVLIEKHFILDKSLGGPDSEFSLDPNDWISLLEDVNSTLQVLGSGGYIMTNKMLNSKRHARSLYVAKDVKKGDVISGENVRSIRPGLGLHPKYFKKIENMVFSRDISFGERMSLDLVEGFYE